MFTELQVTKWRKFGKADTMLKLHQKEVRVLFGDLSDLFCLRWINTDQSSGGCKYSSSN